MSRRWSTSATPWSMLRLLIKHEPLYIAYALPQTLIDAVLPLLYVYFPKLILERLTCGDKYEATLMIIAIYGAALLALNFAVTLCKNKSDMYAERFSLKLRHEIGSIAMDMPLERIESPEVRDAIVLANKVADLSSAMKIAQAILSNIISIAGLAYIIISLEWIFIPLVGVTLLIKNLFVRIEHKRNLRVRKQSAENSRYIEYLLGLTYHSPGGAKEIRLNSLQDWYMRKTKRYRDEMVGIQFTSFSMSAMFNIITAGVVTLQSFAVLWLLVGQYTAGDLSIADFTMVFSTVASLTAILSSLTERAGEYNELAVTVADYSGIAQSLPEKHDAGLPVDTGDMTFEFCDVSFTYPGSEQPVLQHINLKIAPKEKLVIVGENGAGKSTLIKLLCKFYRPTSGQITLNGVDIWQIPHHVYARSIAAVFQDFSIYAFTIAENIAMNERYSSAHVAECAKRVGLAEWLRELPDGLNTYMTPQFNASGIELSGGQAQRLAIARAIHKNAPLLILDEPTASLDPKAESEIYENFFDMTRDKTAIFISHRLATSTIADHIAVFSGGSIAEYGSHQQLMASNGIYARMYRRQSAPYIV